MQKKVNSDVQSLVDLVIQNPGIEGSFRALLIVLGNAPDSSVIVDALNQLDPQQIQSEQLKSDAAELLAKANADDLAARWQLPEPLESNVVALSPHTEVLVKSTKTSVSFDDIGGLENVKKQVRRQIINPFQNKRALFERFRRKAGGGVLMYGPPGCGKTMLARALATECQASFYDVRAADILDQFVGNAEKKIAQIFDQARASRPVVLFFDEVEAIAQRRQFDSTARVNTTVSALLTEMDGFQENNDGILFLGATNVPWALDSAFRRPGRFDRSIFVPPPDRVAREFILKSLLVDRPVDDNLEINQIVEKCPGFSGADLAALVDTAIDIAIEESSSVDELEPLSNAHFFEALGEVKSTVGEWLGQARSFSEYANESGTYDDLAAFLKKYAR